ncbi:MAG: hypothetical protein LBD30_03700 [Verrucomicrobiales bacterium]|jgi:hypothetical protein|nr:hypothetical protein [Verrucomicrobiales bacterium]
MHSLLQRLSLFCCLALTVSAACAKADDSLLEQFSTACFAAKQSAELDELHQKLTSRQQNAAADAEQFRIAANFVKTWQSQLDAYHAGQFTKASDILVELLEQRDWPGLVPRSAVLEVWVERQQPIYWQYAVNHAADAQAVIDGLTWLQSKTDEHNDVQRLKNELRILAELQKILQADTPTDHEQAESLCQPQWGELIFIARLKLLILPRVLPAYLQLDERYRPPADRDDLMAPAYLLDVQRQAGQQNDLVTAWRALTYRRTLEFCDRKDEQQRVFNEIPTSIEKINNFGTFNNSGPSAQINARPVWLEQNIIGLNVSLYGSRLEAKGEIENAAWCYRYALNFILPQTAVTHATERLQFIQKNFPEEYENSRFPRNPNRFRLPPIYLRSSNNPPAFDADSKIMDAGKLWLRY